MAASSMASDDSRPFKEVFTEGPLHKLISQCDTITTASLIGSSRLVLESSKLSATQPASQPFGLPCVLHSHPTKRPWEFNDVLEVGIPCKLTPLDRFSSDAVIPTDLDEQWAGANGDWIITIGLESMWDLVDVYTHCKIPLPSVTDLEATDSAFSFLDDGRTTQLQKIVICQVPIAVGGYGDYSLLALFDYKIAIIHGCLPYGWTILENYFLGGGVRYRDAIIHDDHVFAINENDLVYAWDPLCFGPLLLPLPLLPDAFELHEAGPGMWWLTRSPQCSRLLLVYTRGVNSDPATDDASVVQYGRTIRTYGSGFDCMVFTMDTSRLLPPNRWRRITDLGACSLFLGVNYPINVGVGGANVAPRYLTRSNCVYTSHHAIGYAFRPCPEICRFSLNGIDVDVGFSTSIAWEWSQSPFWFIPSFANALDWNKPVD